MKYKKISVIIPCHNEEGTIKESVKSFQEQSLQPYEIIVVDDGSSDNSVNLIKKLNGAKLIQNKINLGPAGARNMGAKIAKGEILVFAEADGKYSKNYLEKAIKPLEDPKVGGVLSGKRIVWTDKKSLFVQYQNLKWKITNLFILEGKRPIIGAWIFRKKDFERVNGYNEKYRIGEDVDLAQKIKKYGLKLVYVGDTYFYHKDPDTFMKFLSDKKKRKEKTKAENIPSIPKKVQKQILKRMLLTAFKGKNLLLFFAIIYFAFVGNILSKTSS